jgi:hypothetical protein
MEPVVTQFDVTSWNLHGSRSKTTNIFCHDSRFPGQASTPESPAYGRGFRRSVKLPFCLMTLNLSPLSHKPNAASHLSLLCIGKVSQALTLEHCFYALFYSLFLSAIMCILAHEQEQCDTRALGKSKN